jgi:hypothetical protein
MSSATTTATMKKGDLRPDLLVELTEGGAAVPLDGCTVRLLARDQAGATAIDATMTIVDAASGRVSYAWQAGDTDQAGGLDLEIKVTDGSAKTRTFPDDGFLFVTIEEDLTPPA